MERHNGHEWSPAKREALGEIRAGLQNARSYVDRLEREASSGAGTPAEAREPRPGSNGKLAALAVATALDLLARRWEAAPPEPRRKGPGLFKLAILSAAVFAAGKLIAAKR